MSTSYWTFHDNLQSIQEHSLHCVSVLLCCKSSPIFHVYCRELSSGGVLKVDYDFAVNSGSDRGSIISVRHKARDGFDSCFMEIYGHLSGSYGLQTQQSAGEDGLGTAAKY